MEPDDDPEAAEARPRRRQLLVGDEPALVRPAHGRPPGARHGRRSPGPALGHGAGRQGRHAVRQGDRQQRADDAAADAEHARADAGVEGAAVVERDRARPGSDLLRGLLGGDGDALPRPRDDRDAQGGAEGLRGLRRPRGGHRPGLPRGGARRALAPPGDPGREDRQLPPVPADAVERQPHGLSTARPAPTRRGDGPADLRGERPGLVPGHRHHAGGALVRPALRGPRACLGGGKTLKQVHSPMFGAQHG